MFVLFLKSILALVLVSSIIIGGGIGLYRAVNYIEEHTYAAKHRISIVIRSIMAFHLIVLLRGLPLSITLFSLVVQAIFYQLLDSYPLIRPNDPYFVAGTVLAFINHFLFLKVLVKGYLSLLESGLYFIIGVWTTPFCFFLSLSANDEAIMTKERRNATWLGNIFKSVMRRDD
ncbi:Testis Expressed Protein [Astathelohania contejeani]|uniref:Testis Expressed Protein n=1 Tax=Astathelohania contejeani TaxID=164912 RepID=A0ABQ7HWA5_9MICR|nr:Testis Expressed Protein [Thelohania contejeani]